MTCIHSELLAHRVPHRWNTLFGFGLFVLDTKNEAVIYMKENKLGVLIDFFLFFRIAIYSIFCIGMVYFGCLQVNPHIQAVQNMCSKGG